jgi:hypothetical protein
VPLPKASPQAAGRDPQHDKSPKIPSPAIWQGKIKAGHQKGAEIKFSSNAAKDKQHLPGAIGHQPGHVELE